MCEYIGIMASWDVLRDAGTISLPQLPPPLAYCSALSYNLRGELISLQIFRFNVAVSLHFNISQPGFFCLFLS